MRGAGCLDFTVGIVDSSSVHAVHGGKKRERAGSVSTLPD